MEFVTFVLRNNSYEFNGASDVGMTVLGRFLTDDVGCLIEYKNYDGFKDWALADKQDSSNEYGYAISGNATLLDEADDGKTVYFTDITSFGNEIPAIEMSRYQLVKLLDEWREKVCKPKPKVVIIKLEHGEFSIETKD
jgi:hypothetical protein